MAKRKGKLKIKGAAVGYQKSKAKGRTKAYPHPKSLGGKRRSRKR